MSGQVERIIDFWVNEVGPSGWYKVSEELDAAIRSEFEGQWEKAMRGELGQWLVAPEKALALMILLDQFPRNMFRGSAKAFASDTHALAAAKRSLVLGHDLKIDEPQRQFFYLPLMHSESLMDQERCVRLMSLRMPEAGSDNLRHARAHRDVIRQFGRFPYRNAALSRPCTVQERDYLEEGGYALTMRAYAA